MMRHKMGRFLMPLLRQLGRMALRVLITGLIVIVGLTVMSRALGLPILSPSELLDKFKNVSRLGEILS
jgi:hypothetical protein